MLYTLLIILLVLALFGGYHVGPGIGYYGGGGVGLVLVIILIVILVRGGV